jgi:outer membrane protein assembly factor BamB
VATDGRRIYVLSNDNDSGTCVAAALAPRTGEPIWHHRLPSFSFTACAVGGGRMFASCADGVLRVLDADSGHRVADVPLGNPSTAPPTIAPRSVVVGTGAAPFLPGDRLVCLGG